MNKNVDATVIVGDSRNMNELKNEEIDLIVTSPPYWHLKDYGIPKQIGYGQSLHNYLRDLYLVFMECYRVLRKGGRMCINIGDQFARSIIYGKYKVIPIHAEVIQQCEDIGFDYMGSIIWQKKTTMNTTGGANVMGSFPYPPNGIIEIDYEFVLIFKKPGKYKEVPREVKEKSRLTKEEWKEYFLGHWKFPGTKQIGHEAMFPAELPRRLIRMFSYLGDTILDPFLGSGTTLEVALELQRKAIGYEINKDFVNIIKTKVGLFTNLQIVERKEEVKSLPTIDYVPKIKDANPLVEPTKINFKGNNLYKVVEILDENTIRLDTGLLVNFLGIVVQKKKETINYLENYILGRKVFLKFYGSKVQNGSIAAYVYLKNKIFVNAYLIKLGLAKPDLLENHIYKDKFIKIWKTIEDGERMDSKYSHQ